MDARDTYKIQQKYYYDFSFFPIRGLKKRNFFMYKTYSANKQKLTDVFDSILNSEVVDVNCIIAIRKKILKSSLPQTETVIDQLELTLQSVTRLSPSFHSNEVLLFILETIRSLQRTLFNYAEAQQKLTDEMKKLLSNSRFTTEYRTSADDIGHVIDVLQHLNQTITGAIDNFTGFRRLQPDNVANVPAWCEARQNIINLLEGFNKLLHLQQLILLQLRSWKKIRALHEQQQVLN
jgi:hypothetical protein